MRTDALFIYQIIIHAQVHRYIDLNISFMLSNHNTKQRGDNKYFNIFLRILATLRLTLYCNIIAHILWNQIVIFHFKVSLAISLSDHISNSFQLLAKSVTVNINSCNCNQMRNLSMVIFTVSDQLNTRRVFLETEWQFLFTMQVFFQ